MTVHRPTRISTTDEAIRDAVTAELSISLVDESDIATIAHNVAQRIMLPEKVSDITGMEEDDDYLNNEIVGIPPDQTPIRQLKPRRMPGIPGQGPSK